ncbi:hypothetical protein CHS0354_000899 [Potamilus streckersoni]|uniref:Novel STAND NTPase 3 domain-containing protein n=1 Tax=Potamilus streckersoni TaxID=2493646 RepID=A0AAE0S7T0_9BIVA|nr:hypothetical protein CHS0354_000899 [Potamilus streckersoni]
MKAEMATSVPSEKVRDKEYTNWLKVTLALYYMKSGLHTFIQSEFNCLHQSLVQKIYGGQKVPLLPCSICHASLVKRNKYTGTWDIPNQCGSYCDVWLYELLVFHTSPKSEKIYWNNTDVSLWPFSPWQCAKVFMPRGQLPSSTGPAECDAQALLTLLSNCRHFHRKLSPSGLSLTHTVSDIRNKVMHNGEMKLSDTDRKNYIQQIIQLLEDPVSLKSTEDCKAAVGNICKIDNDSVDVVFNVGLEITAMREAVNELRQELGNQEKETAETLEKLKEEYEQLREQVNKRFEDVEKELILHENRMDTIERDIESVKEKTDTVLQQHEKKLQEMHTTVASEQKRFEDVETKMDTIDRDIQSVKEETESLLQQQEKNTQMTEILYERVASQDVRLLAVEENVSKLQFGQKTEKKKSCRKGTNAQKRRLPGNKNGPPPKRILSKKQGTNAQKRRPQDDKNGPAPKRILSKKQETVSPETLSKRRPETEGLKHLKRQTEDKVDTVRRLECILTLQAEKAKKLLEEKRSVVIKGNPGEGKTTTALHLIDNEIYSDRRAVVYSPTDWKMVDTDWVDIIVIEDMFGQSDLDPDRLEKWMVYLPTIQEHVDAGKLQVIITTRVDILSKAHSMLGSLKLFSANLSLMLSSEKLERSEKMGILNRELRRCKRNMKEDKKKQCIANFYGLIGFPQCCSLFAGDDNLFNRGSDFFKSPNKYFAENINKLKDTTFLSLAFLFCSGKISEEYLSSETMPESGNCLLDELTSCLHISKKKASITLLRDAYDRFLGLYVVKSISYKSYFSDRQSCIEFAHAIIYEAVGHTLGNRCPEMIIKYGTSEFLYQQTYTAAAKGTLSQNVFLPVCVYSLLAERMVSDVVKNRLVKSVVKHSALKQSQFVLELEKELLKKRNGAKKFLMTHSHRVSYDNEHTQCFNSLQDSSFRTFLELILEADADTVRLVHNHFLKFLACAQQNTKDCWKCEKKQELLELTLYYHHFEIADKLITMNACYTHTSLSTAARHDDLIRVNTILESLKMNKTFSTKCQEAKKALCNAYISGNQSIIDQLLMEGITLEGSSVKYVVQHGNKNALLDIVEHLRCHNKWIPHWDIDVTDKDYSYLDSCMSSNAFYISDKTDNHPFSTALYLAYANEKLDMADCLVKNGVKVSMGMLENVLKFSQKTVETLIQHLKDADTWNSKCDVASKALVKVYREQKDDLCELLIHNGVLLTMNNLPGVTNSGSLETTKKAIQHLIDIGEWNPKCDVASEALEKAFSEETIEVCELLIQNGVSLTMKNLPGVIYGTSYTAEKAIKHLKETGNWNPMCDDALFALEEAFISTKSDYYNMLTFLTEGSYNNEYMDYDAWILLNDGNRDNDIYTLLTQNGVSFTTKNLFCLLFEYNHLSGDVIEIAFEVISDLKDAGKWDPKCASEALKEAYKRDNCELCYLLIRNGVSLTMADLPDLVAYIVDDDDSEFLSIKEVIRHLKKTGNWNPKCDAASTALEIAFENDSHDVHDLLILEGVPLPLEQNLKDTGNWNPKSYAASEALEKAYIRQNYDRCDLLIQERVSLTMENLPGIIERSLKTFEKAIQHLKDTGNWHSNCNDASKSLEEAFCEEKFDTCELLIQCGVSLTMKNLPGGYEISLKHVEKAIQNLKDTGNWDPECDDASEALEKAFKRQMYDVCELLIQEEVVLTMKNLPGVQTKSVMQAKHHLICSGKWNPKCDDASKTLENAFYKENYDMCNLLIQEGVSLMMNNLPGVICETSLQTAEKAIQNLKDAGKWDPKCDDASEALEKAFCKQKFDVCQLLIHDGVSLTMKNLPGIISLESFKTAVQNLKHTGNWDPKCDDASEALEKSFCKQRIDVSQLLFQDGISLAMNLPPVTHVSKGSLGIVANKMQLKTANKAIQNLKETGNWDPKCRDASKALEIAYLEHNSDVLDILIQEEVSLTMKNLPGIVGKFQGSLEVVKNAIQHMKDIGSWYPTCSDASEALENA